MLLLFYWFLRKDILTSAKAVPIRDGNVQEKAHLDKKLNELNQAKNPIISQDGSEFEQNRNCFSGITNN